jgi:hypothetical protein
VRYSNRRCIRPILSRKIVEIDARGERTNGEVYFVGEILKSGMVPTVIDERTCEVICLVLSADHLMLGYDRLSISNSSRWVKGTYPFFWGICCPLYPESPQTITDMIRKSMVILLISSGNM